MKTKIFHYHSRLLSPAQIICNRVRCWGIKVFLSNLCAQVTRPMENQLQPQSGTTVGVESCAAWLPVAASLEIFYSCSEIIKTIPPVFALLLVSFALPNAISRGDHQCLNVYGGQRRQDGSRECFKSREGGTRSPVVANFAQLETNDSSIGAQAHWLAVLFSLGCNCCSKMHRIMANVSARIKRHFSNVRKATLIAS